MTEFVQMSTSEGEPFKLVVFEDVLIPGPLEEAFSKNLKSLIDVKFQESDILLCSYPKSGTHWTGALIKQMKKKSPDDADEPSFGLLEMSPLQTMETLPVPRQMATHLKPSRIQNALQQENCKIVLVVRNPKDVAVSFYHHLQKSVIFGNKQTWDEYFASVVKGHVPYGSYFDYLDAWENAIKESKNGEKSCKIEVFYFEDLKVNPLENARRLSKHIGFEKTDEELKQVIEACSIGSLREKVSQDKDKIPPPLQDKDGHSIIFRKGDVGDWKNHFKVAQNEVFEKMIASRLKDSMFNFKYE